MAEFRVVPLPPGSNRIAKNLYYKYNLFPLACYEPGEDVQVTWQSPSKMQLGLQIIKLFNLIQQTGSILDLADLKSVHWIGRVSHLEAERILVISKVRQEVLCDALTDHLLGKPPVTPSTPTKVIIDHIHWPQDSVPYILYRQYFCVLYHGTTVYGTNISSLRSNTHMSFDGPYKFENLPPNFVIRAKFYSANFDAFLAKRTKIVELPMMKLRAEAVITADSFRRHKCIFINPTERILPAFFFINGRLEIRPTTDTKPDQKPGGSSA